MSEIKHTPLKLSVEREDLDNGSITYHLWDRTPGNFEWIVGLNDDKYDQGFKAKVLRRHDRPLRKQPRRSGGCADRSAQGQR